ncbi:MAG: calcium-binding protein [Caulobacteraceae bacterium]
MSRINVVSSFAVGEGEKVIDRLCYVESPPGGAWFVDAGIFAIKSTDGVTGVTVKAGVELYNVNLLAGGVFNVEVSGEGQHAIGFQSVDTEIGLISSGVFHIRSWAGDAIGLRSDFRSGLNNDGLFKVVAGGSAIGLEGPQTTLLNSGDILISGGAKAVGFQNCTYVEMNGGKLVVSDANDLASSIAIGAAQNCQVINYAFIKAEYAIYQTEKHSDGQISLDNRGTIEGNLLMGGGDDSIHNSGLIDGDAWLGAGNDYLGDFGSSVRGVINGQAGNDTLLAGSGRATLNGGAGDDALIGGAGTDVLIGGAGHDDFGFSNGDLTANAPDVITDLQKGDKISLRGIDADTLTDEDQAFVFVSEFDGHAGELVIRYSAKSDRTIVAADLNGDSVADLRLVLLGDHSDFNNWVL